MIAAPVNYNTIVVHQQSPSTCGSTTRLRVGLNKRNSEDTPPIHTSSGHHQGPLVSFCQEKGLPRRVRFDLTPSIHFGRLELTADEKNQMFWNAEAVRRQARVEAALYVKTLRDRESSRTTPYEMIYNAALDACCSSGRIENAHSLVVSSSSSCSYYRGLEQFIVKGMSKRRIGIVRRLLKAQSALPTKLDRHQQAVLLYQVSKSLTRSSRRMGRVFAIGDAQAAAES